MNQLFMYSTKPNRSKPKWYSTSVVEAKRVRRPAERKWQKTRSSTDRLAYYFSKQAMRDVLVEAKSNYFRNSLVNANPKDAFQIVNELTTTPRQIPAILDTPRALANDFSYIIYR